MRNTAHKKAGTVTAILMIFGLLAVTAILPVNATESYIRGDSNGDGVVSIGDVTAIQRHLAELEHLVHAADEEALQVELRRDAHHAVLVERVEVGEERLRGRAAGLVL